MNKKPSIVDNDSQTNAKHQIQAENKSADILVSIVLTESTTSILNLSLPHLEDTENKNCEETVCLLKPQSNIENETLAKFTKYDSEDFANHWFGEVECNSDKKKDGANVSTEIAYLRVNSDMEESTTSLENMRENPEFRNRRHGGSSASLNEKLKPINVLTRPLFTAHSQAHEDMLNSESNNIYVNVINSMTSIPDAEWSNVCRICHGGESIGELLSPCHCRGSIEQTHLECLERWLKESSSSRCELCQHHFHIIRKPMYGVFESIFIFLRHPGEHIRELLLDLFAFLIYTPATIGATYMLMLLCESIGKSAVYNQRNPSVHIMTFAAVIGMAAIDFIYSSWLAANFKKHVIAWRYWYRSHCEIKIVLPERQETTASSELNLPNILENEID